MSGDTYYECSGCGSKMTPGGADVPALLQRIAELEHELQAAKNAEEYLREARRDSERLDWLEQHEAEIEAYEYDDEETGIPMSAWAVLGYDGGRSMLPDGSGKTLREAIDAAIGETARG